MRSFPACLATYAPFRDKLVDKSVKSKVFRYGWQQRQDMRNSMSSSLRFQSKCLRTKVDTGRLPSHYSTQRGGIACTAVIVSRAAGKTERRKLNFKAMTTRRDTSKILFSVQVRKHGSSFLGDSRFGASLHGYKGGGHDRYACDILRGLDSSVEPISSRNKDVVLISRAGCNIPICGACRETSIRDLLTSVLELSLCPHWILALLAPPV